MTPRIESLVGMILIGMHLPMSLANNRTGDLWRSFMPRRREIANKVDSRFISLRVYGNFAGHLFDLATPFVKWAAVLVKHLCGISEGYRSDNNAAVEKIWIPVRRGALCLFRSRTCVLSRGDEFSRQAVDD